MTTQVQEIISQLFDKKAEQNLSASKVFGEVFNAICNNAKKDESILKYLIPSDAEQRKQVRADMLRKFFYAMPHIVEAGTGKLVVCDMVEADPEKEYAQAFCECRPSVDDEATKYPCAVTMAQAEREVAMTETIKYASGFEKVVPALDENGKVIKEKRIVNLVPREKTQWGYTSVVKKAIINAIIMWEIEQGLA
jgi:hypothetical protein